MDEDKSSEPINLDVKPPETANHSESSSDQSGAGTETQTNESETPVIVGTEPPKNKKKSIFLVLIILLAVGGAAYWWFMMRDSGTTNNNSTNQQVKKDVDLIRYALGEGGMNEFYPDLEVVEATMNMNRQIYEGLVGFENKTTVVPLLATGWTNPDASTWIFTLKSDAKFHTGKALTAKDVLYSYEQVKKNELLASDVIPTIKTIEAVGDNQVKIVTDGVDPILLNRLTNLFILDSDGNGEANPKFGTGPYTLKEGTNPTAEHVELVAFDGYHGGHIYTREIQFSVYIDGETDEPGTAEKKMVSDIKDGKIDLAGFLSGDNLNAAKEANYELFPVDDVAVYQMAMNVNKAGSPLQKVKVREAIYKAVDVKALLRAIGRNGVVANQGVPSYIPGFNPDIAAPTRDVEAAKKLLAEAGYPNGTTITLTVFTAAQDVGEELVRQFKEANITVKLDVQSDGSALQAAVEEGTMEAFYYAEGSLFADGSDVFSREFQTKNYSSGEIDELQTKANTTLDQKERLDLLKQVSKSAMDDTAIIPLYINQPTWVANKPYVMTQDLLTSDIGVLFYKVYLAE